MKRIISLLFSGLMLVAISAGVIGQTTAEDEDFLLSLLPAILTALYHRAEPDNTSFADAIDIIALESKTPQRFDFKLSAYPVGEGVRYRWNFGDGQSAQGVPVSHDYGSVGYYSVQLTIDVPGYAAQSLYKKIEVKPENQLPYATFTASTTSGYAPLEVSFDAGSSTDSDGKLVRYLWQFGDGSSASGRTVSHQYQSIGLYSSYAATLTVTDDRGGQNKSTAHILVNRSDLRPTARILMTPQSADAPIDIEFDARTSSDIDGQIVDYAWDFGDGDLATGDQVWHSYEQAGVYEVALTVEDNTGAKHTDRRSIVVTPKNQAPQAQFSSSSESGSAPFLATFDASQSLDMDGRIARYSWDFGDGTIAQGVAVSHTYTRPGEYQAVLMVTDAEGGVGTAQHLISVSGTPVPGPLLSMSTYDASTEGNPFPIQGIAPAGQQLSIFVNDVLQTKLIADDQGEWQFDAYLQDGENQIRATMEIAGSGTGTELIYLRNVAYYNTISRDLSGLTIQDTRVLTPGIPPRAYTVAVRNGTIAVAPGAKLILQPGVEIRFHQNFSSVNWVNNRLQIDGSLLIRGSDADPVLLTSYFRNDDGTARNWSGIEISETADIVMIDHVIMEQARSGIRSDGTSISFKNSYLQGGGIRLDSTWGWSTIFNSVIEGRFSGIDLSGSTYADITENTFRDMYLDIDMQCIAREDRSGWNCPYALIHANNFSGGGRIRVSDMMASGSSDAGVDATGNWWGTTDVKIIGENKVNFQGFLDGPVPQGKAFRGDIFDQSGNALPMGNEIRLASGQTYVAYSGIQIPRGVRLIFEPGASLILDATYSSFYDLTIDGELVMQAGASIMAGGHNTLRINGEIAVNGTADQAVHFSSLQSTPEAGDWEGIYISAAARQVSIHHAQIEYAQSGILFDHADGELKDSLIQNNRDGILAIGNAAPLITGNTIRFNRDGVFERGSELFPQGPDSRVIGNNIDENWYHAVSLSQRGGASRVRLMSGNWWGSTDAVTIAEQLQDHTDDERLPYIDFSGYLDGPMPDGVPYNSDFVELSVINEDLTLSAGQNVVVLGDVYVPAGVTLTLAQGAHLNMENAGYSLIVDGTLLLEAGAVIEFAGRDQRIEINGRLVISGTATNPVRIGSSHAPPEEGDWQGIHITAGADPVSIDYLEIRHAERGIWFDGASGRVENSVFSYNQIGVLASSAAMPQLAQNSYSQNYFDTRSYSHDINSGGSSLRARFSVAESMPGSPYARDFDATDSYSYGSSNYIVAYAWDFGDGTRSGDIQVSHIFSGAGRYVVSLGVLDQNGGFDSFSQELNVLAPNAGPTAIAGQDQFVETGTTVILDGFQSYDTDGSIKHYRWRQLSGAPVALPAPDQGRNTFSMPDIGVGQSLVFELTVSDNRDASASDTLSITQLAFNTPPEAFAGPDQHRDTGEMVILDGSFSHDEDGPIEAYHWTQVSGPAVVLSDEFSEKASFIMPALLADQSLVFELTVSDNRGAMSSDQVSIEGPKEVTLISTVSSGIAPLEVSFIVKTDLHEPIVAYGMDYDGDGTIDVVATGPDNFEFTYTQQGSYAPYVSVLDADGNYHIDRISIEVVSEADEIALISAQWQAMAQALINGDVEAAMAYIADYKYEDYQQLFTSMGVDKLSAIFGNSTEIYLQTLTDNLALCRVVRVEAAGRFTYPVRFMKGSDGVWKLLRF